jgi:hypothetical protein
MGENIRLEETIDGSLIELDDGNILAGNPYI